MEVIMKVICVAFYFLLYGYCEVYGYCAPGTDTNIDVLKPLNSQKVSVPIGGETVLEVRYKNNPIVKWDIDGKEIPAVSNSKHFEFVNDGSGNTKVGPKLKIKNFQKSIAGKYRVAISNAGCTNSKIIDVVVDTSFNLQYYIDIILKKVPYLKTKAGICLFLVGFAFIFIIIPLLICCALCSKIRKTKKELEAEKGKMEMYFEYENKKSSKHHKHKSAKKSVHREKSSHKERQALVKENSSSEDLPNARHVK